MVRGETAAGNDVMEMGMEMRFCVEEFFVVKGEGSNLRWECEDDVEVLGGEQFGAAVLEPLLACDALALCSDGCGRSDSECE